jgi:hypothetical protein
LQERLAVLKRQHAESLREAAEHTQRYADLLASSDEEIATARTQLVDGAEAAWEGWTHAEQSWAVQELLRIDASLLRRAIRGEIDAGRDPYASDGALSLDSRAYGPVQPTPRRILEGATRDACYRGLNPLRLSAAVSDLQAMIAAEQQPAGQH